MKTTRRAATRHLMRAGTALAAVALAAGTAPALDVYLVAREFTSNYVAAALNFTGAAVQPYGDGQDISGTATIGDAGRSLYLAGNTWKKIDFPYTVTAGTIMEFDFRGAAEGEVHGIGFDDDDSITPGTTFRLYGTQDWGISSFDNYASGAPAWKHYLIPVGQYFTGQMDYMTFVNDHDVAGPTAAGAFRNIRVYERSDAGTVPMWGYAEDADGDLNTDDGEVPTSPGPMISVAPADASLTIHLRNDLPESTSLVIPGQTASLSPVTFSDGQGRQRVRSFTYETAPSATGVYSWSSLRPGTYIYQSGTHPAVQVQMGLYGAVTKDAAPGTAYAGSPRIDASYDSEVVLFYSEIDRALHEAVDGGTYGSAAYPSTIDYRPQYFLVNGEPHTEGSEIIPAGSTGKKLLIRFLNAGLKSHVPAIGGLYMSLIAEDGNTYPYPKEQYSALLPAGKTLDAIAAPAAAGVYPVYDRRLYLTNADGAAGGMLAYLGISEPTRLAVLREQGTNDHNLYYYRNLEAGDWRYWDAASRNPSPLARDLWEIPGGDNVMEIARARSAGPESLHVLKNEGAGDMNLYLYNGLAEADWTAIDAAARNPSPLARDLWVIPAGDNAVAMTAVDVNGDGNDELAVLKKEGVSDMNIYFYNAIQPGDWRYWDAAARNPSPLARDLWRIPSGGEAVRLAAIDAGDGAGKKLALIKRDGGNDLNLYYYNIPLAGDWRYWDAAARNPSPFARDFWLIPSGANIAGIAAADIDRDGREELSVMKQEGASDMNLYCYRSLSQGDWRYWDAAARNPSPIARDFWAIPGGNDAVGLTAVGGN